ncbi:ribonucleoside-diphosphate reductase subunit alpha [Pelagibaculum spongiae]|uniref:Ribonucleoside-diphosphate reductase n=1 Tax=Pelagibaculum spongiae TaxID=2080658 RepID=A0A2V1GY07_9GAMM|nr:ribonucleoside-diphosphate reductase subunit alpha [Pelagibaculum spongiae]PVZ71974.1 ribonucleoside-diphosphate reductase subunit alpha [Pelagibaculum spongiae]
MSPSRSSNALASDNSVVSLNQKYGQASTDLFQVRKRSGEVTTFDAERIRVAISKAFLAVEFPENSNAIIPERIHQIADQLTAQVLSVFFSRMPTGGTLDIEQIQDQVELALMRDGHQLIARAYVLYREAHALARQASKETQDQNEPEPAFEVQGENGQNWAIDRQSLIELIKPLAIGLEAVDLKEYTALIFDSLYQGIAQAELESSLLITASSLIEKEPEYDALAARLLLSQIRQRVAGTLQLTAIDADALATVKASLAIGIENKLINPQLAEFDLAKIAEAINFEADKQFSYLGLQTIFDRYLLHVNDQRIETPQLFFMRVAMGLALNEADKETRAIEFYQLLSSFDYMASTPTLFNSGTLRSQLSSCYLTTIPDHLDGIFDALKDNALLSKWAGGLGNDWTPVRALGAHIKGTNGKSQGVVPFLKVANDTAVAVNQGGKRKGAVCAYLEVWHLDIEEFLELRKNTGDDRRRTHDMNTACWVPDLFMQRLEAGQSWTLFSPDEAIDLHDLYGKAFEKRYLELEKLAEAGELRQSRQIAAKDLWRKMLGMLFETGHPWITFKDPCNLRSPQQHTGVVHSSNLCTEITLNTSDTETAVCNLGSVNLPAHLKANGDLDLEKLQRTITTAVRMLDNVVDINYYPTEKAKTSNMQHRPVGMGMMGFQDALYKKSLSWDDPKTAIFADQSMEVISYFALSASSDLAKERGVYSSYQGSLWSKGILPIDSINLLENARQPGQLQMNLTQQMDWPALREKIAEQGMRNSNLLAIAPTATISNIVGVSQSIEPSYSNLYVKSNLSGEFTVVNPWLVKALKAEGLWDEVMVNDLKYFDGSVAQIERIPAAIRAQFATAFELDSESMIVAASRRQKWIDQAQSLNLYMGQPSGQKLDEMYRSAWRQGLKTTYYLRSLGATSTEKSTVQQGSLSSVAPVAQPAICSIDNPDCEACQ